MYARGLCAVALAGVIAGCGGRIQGEPTVLQAPDSIPTWAQRNGVEMRDSTARTFIGIGHGTTEEDALRAARTDARVQHGQAVGGLVVTSDRLYEEESSADSGIRRASAEAERFSGFQSTAFVQGDEINQFVTSTDVDFIGYVQLAVPEGVITRERERLSAKRETEVKRRIEAKKLADSAHSESEPVYAYVKATGTSEYHPGGPSRSRIEANAVDAAEHKARVAVTQKVNGSTLVSTVRESGGDITHHSHSVSTGRIYTEVLSRQIWWEGASAVARVYMLGWSPVKGVTINQEKDNAVDH